MVFNPCHLQITLPQKYSCCCNGTNIHKHQTMQWTFIYMYIKSQCLQLYTGCLYITEGPIKRCINHSKHVWFGSTHGTMKKKWLGSGSKVTSHTVASKREQRDATAVQTNSMNTTVLLNASILGCGLILRQMAPIHMIWSSIPITVALSDIHILH